MEASGAVGAVIGGAIGMEQGRQNNRANKKSAEQQYQNQRKLNEQAKALGLQQWKDTNYSAQVREANKAGLSTGLLYGGGGAGGATTNTGSGGSAGQQAPSNIDMATPAMAGTGLGMQLQLMKAQKDNVEANTNKTNVETAKLGGEDTGKVIAETGKITQETKNAELNAKMQELLNNKEGRTQEEQIEMIKALNQSAQANAVTDTNEAHISTNTVDSDIRKKKAESVGAGLENILKESQAQLQGAQRTEIKARIRKMQQDVAQGWNKLSIEQQRAKIQLFAEELKAEYPSVGQSIGKQVNEILRYLEDLSGVPSGHKRVE